MTSAPIRLRVRAPAKINLTLRILGTRPDGYHELRTMFQSLLSGLFVTLGNPKAMLFYLALVPTLVDITSITLRDYFILIVVSVTVLLAVTIPYILLAAKARDFFRHPLALKRLNRISASFLAATAGYIAIRAN